MTALTGRTPKSTFGDLLQISNSNTGMDITLRTLEDGEGSNGPLQLSTVAVRFLSTTTVDFGAGGGTFDMKDAAFKADTIVESTAAAGVTIDSVLIKDAGITATGGGSLTGTWSDLGTVTTVDINGGTIDGNIIGGAAQAAGSFTALVGTTGTFSDVVSVDDTTDSTSTTTGSIHTDGGLGVAKDTYLGGVVNMAGQPTFLAFKETGDGNQDNATGNGTDIKITYPTEQKDVGADFNVSTSVHTAPLTGEYVYTVGYFVQNLTSSMTFLKLTLVTSNDTYTLNRVDGFSIQDSSASILQTWAAVVPMDASDTAEVHIQVSNGAGDTVDIIASAGPLNFFAGRFLG